MKEMFQLDGPLMRFLCTVADMMIMSIMWLICSLPIVTVGASTVALYTIMMGYTEDDTTLIRRYLKAFRENFWKGSAAGILFLLVCVILIVDIRIIGNIPSAVQVLFWIGVAICAVVFVHIFPLLASFEQTLFRTLKNALFIGLSNLPTTVLLLLIHALPLAAAVLNPNMFVHYALPAMIFMGTGILALLNARILKKIYAKYLRQETKKIEEYQISG